MLNLLLNNCPPQPGPPTKLHLYQLCPTSKSSGFWTSSCPKEPVQNQGGHGLWGKKSIGIRNSRIRDSCH